MILVTGVTGNVGGELARQLVDANQQVRALVYDPTSDASNVTALDARDLSAGPLARAWFDHHVPGTYHGAFAPAQAITS